MSRRNSSFKPNKPKLDNDLDDLDDAFDAEQNPFSSTQVSSSSSKWSINESWKKIQQMIESKDKTNQNNKNKEINSQELANFTNDMDIVNDILDYSIYEGQEIQEGEDISVDDLSSDLNEEKDLTAVKKETNISLPKSSANNQTTTSSSNLTSTSSNLVTTTNKIQDNKKDDTTLSTSIKNTHNQTFLFSKMKKNCSIERLNELDDKNNELPSTDKRNSIKDELIKPNDLINVSKYSPSQIKHQIPQIKFNAASTKQSTQSSNKTPIKSSTKKQPMNRIEEFNLSDEESSVDGFNATDSSIFNRVTFKKYHKQQKKSKPSSSTNQLNVDDPIPSLPYFMSFIVDQFRQRFNLITVTSSVCTFFVLIFAIQLSPLSSFANGFIIGIIFSLLFLIIIVIYGLNYIFQKIDHENELHDRIMRNERWKKYPAYKKIEPDEKTIISLQRNSIHEGWFFELVYSKKLGVDRLSAAEKTDYDKMPDTKLQLTYIKLEGTMIRVYVPKADQSKKMKPDMEKVNFLKVSNKMNQHIYDFSKMNNKKIHLWLPKNIINKKKYLFSRKFPFILHIETTSNKLSESKGTPLGLILFCRTNRDKEEWYNKFRQSIEMADQNLQIHHLSTAASTPDEVTHENENEQTNLPRTKSLDIGNISYEFEHLSSFLNYETFIQDLLSHNLYSVSGGNSSQQATSSSNGNQQNNPPNETINVNSNLFWFNALVGRVFYDFLTHPHWTRWVQLKIQRKLSRVKLPYFIQTITLKDVNLGSSLPKFLSVANNPVIDERGIWLDFDLDYSGCFSMTLETKLDLMKLKETKAPERELKPLKSPNLAAGGSGTFDYDDLSDPESIISLSDEDSEENLSIENDARQGRIVKLVDKLVTTKYFQQATDTKFLKKKMEEVSNLPILLTVNILKLKGQLTLNFPPPPTDRLWYGFRSIDQFNLDCKPSFGERLVSLAPITTLLSKKLKQEFYKILVLPNMDDIVLNNIMMGNEDVVTVDEVP